MHVGAYIDERPRDASRKICRIFERDCDETVWMCALLLAVGGNAAAGAGSGSLRNLRADSRGRDEQFQNHVADPPNCGCVRPARDRHAKPESGRRLGGQDHDHMGTRQRASRAVDFPAAKRRHAVPGWENTELSAEAVTPFHGQLMVKPLAWTPSTKGIVTAQVVLLDPPGLALPTGPGFNFFGAAPPPPEPKWSAPPMPAKAKPTDPKQPTQAELDAYLNSVKDKVRGAIVFVGKHVDVSEDMNPAAMRRPEDEWKSRFDAKNPQPFRFPEQPKLPEGQLTRAEVSRQVDQFLVDNGAAARINDAGHAHGV